MTGTLMGLTILYISISGPASYPDRKDLKTVTGSVTWAQPGRYGIDFKFDGDARKFFYAHKSGDWRAVGSALVNASEQPVFILFSADSPQRGESGESFFQVYGIAATSGPIRTYEQVRQAWRQDYRYGYVAAALALIAAGFLEFVARKMKKSGDRHGADDSTASKRE